METRKFNRRRNNNKANSIETWSTVIAHLFPEVIKRSVVQHAFLITDDAILSLPLEL